jgi:hypothetical protein
MLLCSMSGGMHSFRAWAAQCYLLRRVGSRPCHTPTRRHVMRPHQKVVLIEQYGAGTFMIPQGAPQLPMPLVL